MFAIQIPKEIQKSIRKKVESLHHSERLELLRELDPQALILEKKTQSNDETYPRIHLNDTYRVFRP